MTFLSFVSAFKTELSVYSHYCCIDMVYLLLLQIVGAYTACGFLRALPNKYVGISRLQYSTVWSVSHG